MEVDDKKIVEYMQSILEQEDIRIPVYVEDYTINLESDKFARYGNYPFAVKDLVDFISILKYIKKTRGYYPHIFCIKFDPEDEEDIPSVIYNFHIDSVIYLVDIPYHEIIDHLEKLNKKTPKKIRGPETGNKSVYDELFGEGVR